MCGIIGYIGKQEAVPILMDGLRRLEYRGYDSAGIAVVDKGELHVRRSAGKLKNLEEAIRLNPMHGFFGVGHTRWATHGRPTEENAHPHLDCTTRIVVVHNGIIENYLELRNQLRQEKHRFLTETDTETISHLIEKHYRGNLAAAVVEAVRQLRGIYACAVLSTDEPERIIGVRNGPPLVIGVGDGEFFVASDIPAILHFTRNIVFLENQEIVTITKSGVEIQDFDGKAVRRFPQQIHWDPELAEIGGWPHYMLKEIFEQPCAIRKTMARQFSVSTGEIDFDHLEIGQEELARVERIHLIAAGTSFHAALVGKYLLEELAQIPAEADIASEFRYRKAILSPRTLTIAISQSGETADTIAALREAKRLGSLALSISNVVRSMITREAQGSIYTCAGPEIGVASTKAFTTQLVVLFVFALYMVRLRKTQTQHEIVRHLRDLSTIANLAEVILQKHEELQEIAKHYFQCRDFLFLGRGIQYPIALEGALKLKEISYIHAEGYPAGEMKHGPIALIDETVPVVALVPSDRHYEKMLSNIMEAKARDGQIVLFATEGDQTVRKIADHVFYIPKTDPLLTPILSVIPLQLFAYYVAVLRGCEVDQPRNLAKSVTVE